jgi:hypothetical protein
MLLGDPMRLFHQELAELHALRPNFRFHYVSAWEMAQLVHQAERGAAAPELNKPCSAAAAELAIAR